ncbi:MAG: MFS transporter [Puia sp.]
MPKQIKKQHHGIANTLAFALMPLSGFATDIYLPSLPTMAGSLHVSSLQVQITLSLFLISYGVGQLFIGSVLDSFGRYNLSLISLMIFALASLVIACTHSIYLIYGMRIVHGLTVSAIVVSKRAYFIDLYTGDRLKHYLSLFTIIWSTGPIMAPFIGGYLEQAFGWQSNFYFLAIFAILLLVLEWIFSGETLSYFSPFRIQRITVVYIRMIRTIPFMLGLLLCGLSYGMVMIYNMTGPFIIEHALHLSPVIAGYGSLILGLAWMTGGFIGKATINRPFFKRIVINLIFQVVFVTVMLLSVRHISNVYALIFFAFIIQVAAGYTFNNFYTYCLTRFPKNAGIASGFTGGANYVIISLVSSAIVFFLPARDEYNLGFSYLILILLSMLVMGVLRLKKVSLED